MRFALNTPPRRQPSRSFFFKRSARRASASRRGLLALFMALLLALFSGTAWAQYTVVNSGSNAVFTAPLATASAYAWTLDGSSVGTNSRTFTYSAGNFDVGTHDLIVYQTLATGGTTSREWGVRVKIPIPTSPIVYYVAPTGSDSNGGSINAPFNTLERALTAIRGVSKPFSAGGVTVFLRSGTYWRTSTFTLTGTDCGTPTAPIIFSSYPGETAVLSTGTALPSSAWSQLALSETNRVTSGVDPTRIWETDASNYTNKGPYPAHYSTWPVRNALDASAKSVPDVFYNDARVWLSRYPNHNLTDDSLTPNLAMDGIAADSTGTNYLNTSGTYLTSSSAPVKVGGAFYYYPSDESHVSRWKTAITHGGLWLQGYWRVTWQSDLCQVLDIDSGNQVIEFASGAAPSGGFGNKYAAAPSGYSGRPGNKAEPYWVVNLLEEIDQTGEWCVDFNRNKLYFLMDQTGAPPSGSVVVADYTGPVVQISGSNIILQSLTFDESLGEAVLLSNTASSNLVIGCTFRNVTNMAVSIQSGTANGVVSCNMDQMGSMVTQITSASTSGSATPAMGNYIVNDEMIGVGRYAKMYMPGVNLVTPASGNRVGHTCMYDLPHMGVQPGGYRNLYDFNNIGKYGTQVDDNGAFYCYEDDHGFDTYRYNYCHDTPLASAITFDGVNRTVTGNFFGNLSDQNSSCEGQSIGIGKCDQINCVNNMAVGGGRYGSFDFTAQSQLNVNNNVAVEGYYPPDFNWSLWTIVNGTNVFTATTGSVLSNGSDLSYSYDPGFINLAGEDLRLRPDSRVFSDLPSFKRIPFEMFGVYNDEYRSDATVFTPFVIACGGGFVGGTQALLTGTLVYPELDLNTTVSIYYGPVDSGTNAASWAGVVNLGTLASGSLSAVVGAQPNQPVYFRILAANSGGQMWSESTAAAYPAPPSQPTGLTVTAAYAQNTLSWNAATYASSYTVERAPSVGGPYVTVAAGLSGTSYTDTGLVTGQTYYYEVVAANFSGSASATAPAQGIPTPGTAEKANNTNSLDQGSSWTLGAVPTIYDTALWDNTYTCGSAGVGGNLTAYEIQVTNPLQAVTIGTGTGAVTLGAGGIDLSAATQNLTISAPVALTASQGWLVPSGRTLTVSGTIDDGGLGCGLSLTGSGTFVLTFSNTYSGGVTIAPPSGGLPTYNFGSNNPAAYLKLTNGSIGVVIANGRLDILNGANVGAIGGSGSQGMIDNLDTTNNTVAFQPGSSFSMFNFGADYSSATLTSTGTSPIYFAHYGYNTGAPHAAYTLSGGTWYLNQIGQNNTGCQTSGTTTVTGGAFVEILAQTSYSHGTWNVANGTLQFAGSVGEFNGNGTPLNTSLNLSVSGGNSSLLVNGAITLGDGGSGTNSNGLSVAGGSVTMTGLTIGSSAAGRNDTNTVNLSGGELAINGALGTVVSGSTSTSNLSTAAGSSLATIQPYQRSDLAPGLVISGNPNIPNGATIVSISGGTIILSAPATGGSSGIYVATTFTGGSQNNAFNWTGGQLTAATINPGAGFSGTGSSLTSNTLIHNAGILAPGDIGTAGKTTINGNYLLGAAGTLAIDIGSATQASSFQNGTGYYDYISVSGTSTLSGSLAVTLINNFTPTNAQTFTILSSPGALSAAFSNLVSGTRVITNNGIASFRVSGTGNVVVLSNFQPLTVTAPPASGTVSLGSPFSFGVTATGPSASQDTYQWYLGGSPITGATNSTYSIASVQVSDGGAYTVLVSSTVGSVTSSTAALTILLAPLQAGWSAGDLGNPSVTGTATVSSGTYTVVGSGTDIFGTADQCQFAYTPWTGDGALLARVTDLGNTNILAKAAVMFRDTLAANSIEAGAELTSGSGCEFQYRASVGGTSTYLAQTTGVAAPRWIKLMRSGTAYRAFQAPDVSGTAGTWTQIGSAVAAISMSSPANYAGLAVTSHNAGASCTAHFDHVTLYAPPVLSMPSAVVVEATGSSGAVATFSVSGSGNIDGVLPVSANPASGTVFALGTTSVVVSATDSAGDVTSGSFTVVVRDTTPPTVTVPANITMEATGSTGAIVAFTTSAVDIVSGTRATTNTPASGSAFPVGITTVVAKATDAAGNTGSNSFTVTVRDTTPPVVIVPSNIVAEATGPSGAVVTFFTSATDLVSGSVATISTPPSGSVFPLGATTVVTTATDAAGNSAGASFTVTVTVQPVTAAETHASKLAVSGSTLSVSVDPSVPGRTYQLQRTDSLTSGTWTSVGTPQVGDGVNAAVLSDSFDRTVLRRFYRLQLGP